MRFYQYETFSESTVKNLFVIFKEKYFANDLDQDVLRSAIRETIEIYTGKKMNAIKVF